MTLPTMSQILTITYDYISSRPHMLKMFSETSDFRRSGEVVAARFVTTNGINIFVEAGEDVILWEEVELQEDGKVRQILDQGAAQDGLRLIAMFEDLLER